MRSVTPYTGCLEVRDNYDKEVKASKQNKRNHFTFNNRPKRPDAQRYIPPKPEDWDQPEQNSSEDDDMPKTLFRFEFEDKDGKIYKQYVKEGVKAEVLAMRMGYDRNLSKGMIKALEQRLQDEIDRRTKS
ncbi:uncharacterized protein LOC123564390 isoform X2 [Mercenaria mercenaria]|uniref:uncharacterized protein LOC123564390 isoform X2 n=1 Tax=Mercenaria mercenaria TaxID=6596 RepID=UPI001E1E1B4A|nr:uncharacterized protein LOC123564390 isoform X2 [Mercenaria mercenaria]